MKVGLKDCSQVVQKAVKRAAVKASKMVAELVGEWVELKVE